MTHDYDGKLHAQQAALRKLQRKYDAVKGDLLAARREAQEKAREADTLREALAKAVDTFSDLRLALSAIGHPTAGEACRIAEDASREALAGSAPVMNCPRENRLRRWICYLMERVREKVAKEAPTAPAHGHPTPEEWDAWARESLSPEDAERFLGFLGPLAEEEPEGGPGPS